MAATTYRLLPRYIWDNLIIGNAFEVGGRSRWKFTLYVSRVIVPGNLVLAVETSPTGEENTWNTLFTFDEVVDVGKQTKSSGGQINIDPVTDVLIRARVLTITGRWIGELFAEASFMNPKSEEDLALLSEEFKKHPMKDLILAEAERDVMKILAYDVQTGELDIDLTLPDAQEAIKAAIAEQAEHIRLRMLSTRGSKPTIMPRYTSNIGEILAPYRPHSSRVWYGQ